MAIRIVRLGTPRAEGEGLRLGTVRRPPRGVRKADYARRNYYDVWLPDLAPSARLVARAQKNWPGFAKAYRREMKAAAAERLIAPPLDPARGAGRAWRTIRLSPRSG